MNISNLHLFLYDVKEIYLTNKVNPQIYSTMNLSATESNDNEMPHHYLMIYPKQHFCWFKS